MGLHPSKDASQELKSGSLIPTGIYASSIHDYDYPTVRNLILQRRMAPFYRGSSPTTPLTPALLVIPNINLFPFGFIGQQDLNPVYSNDSAEVHHSIGSKAQENPRSHQSLVLLHPKISLWSKYRTHRKESLPRPPPVYKDAVECPICFLYYPANINYARCCHQPICTECFVHIRAPDSGITAASCPFCVEPNFGIEYHAPSSLDGEKHQHGGADDHSIVTIDRIRPQHTRIVPSRHHRDAASSSAIGSTRRIIVRPSETDPDHFTPVGRDYRDYLTAVRQMNMDLEELMIMEAIRLSLIEQSTQSSESTSDSTTPDTNRSVQDNPVEL